MRKHRIRLAIENHKGWRAAEQAAWIKRVGSEYVGVCFDFGNNISLCEAPEETFRLLGPLAIFCHIKDMAVELYPDGFLLSEVPFGEGILNIPSMVADAPRERDPNMLFCLVMITRDPLKIPVFTDKYWVTFEDAASPLPGRDLARVLERAPQSLQNASSEAHWNEPGSPAQTGRRQRSLVDRLRPPAPESLALFMGEKAVGEMPSRFFPTRDI